MASPSSSRAEPAAAQASRGTTGTHHRHCRSRAGAASRPLHAHDAARHAHEASVKPLLRAIGNGDEMYGCPSRRLRSRLAQHGTMTSMRPRNARTRDLPWRRCSLECSLGTSPRYAVNARAERKRRKSWSSAGRLHCRHRIDAAEETQPRHRLAIRLLPSEHLKVAVDLSHPLVEVIDRQQVVVEDRRAEACSNASGRSHFMWRTPQWRCVSR